MNCEFSMAVGHRGPLVGLLVVSAGLFMALALVLSQGQLAAFDAWLLNALREPLDPADPVGPAWVERAIRDITALGGNPVLILLTLGAGAWLWLRGQASFALLLLIAVVGGVLLNFILKAGFDRPRPDIVPHGQTVYTASFPSGHAMNATIVYLMLGLIAVRRQMQHAAKYLAIVLAGLLAFAIGCSRVYLGVHWPSDVIAGWLAGLAWVSGCWLLAGALCRRCTYRVQ